MPKKEVIVEKPSSETRVSKAFVNILAILSVLGFISIISYTLFDKNIEQYVEALWLGILGFGFII